MKLRNCNWNIWVYIVWTNKSLKLQFWIYRSQSEIMFVRFSHATKICKCGNALLAGSLRIKILILFMFLSAVFYLRKASFLVVKPPCSTVSLAQDYLEFPWSSWMDGSLRLFSGLCPRYMLLFVRKNQYDLPWFYHPTLPWDYCLLHFSWLCPVFNPQHVST